MKIKYYALSVILAGLSTVSAETPKNNCKVFYFKNPVAWIAKSNLSLNELIAAQGPFSVLPAHGITSRQINTLVEKYGVRRQMESPRQVVDPIVLAKSINVFLRSHTELNAEQINSVETISSGKVISDAELSRIWATPTSMKSLVFGLTNWLFQKPQTVQRDFRLKIRSTFWQSIHETTNDKSGISKADIEGILDYYARHLTLADAPLTNDFAVKVISLNRGADYQRSQFVIGGTPLYSSLHPEFFTNAEFVATLAGALFVKGTPLGELAAKEYLRYLYFAERGTLTKTESDLFDLLRNNYPNVRSVIKTFDRQPGKTIGHQDIIL
ncbi:MAG: hypothetical protein JNL11_05625 [Bdellovibrionaceae bacterium]|nr:hypothetical protein [Pseudobdellovibrionaceae bacterium]